MVEISVLLRIKDEPSKEKINEELNWYDTIKQEMLVFHGGKLSFRYQEDPYLVKLGAEERQRRGIKSIYRMLPQVEDLVVNNYFNMVKDSNRKEIESWFCNYNIYHDSDIEDITGESIIFNVPDNEQEEFCDELDRHGFEYE